MELTYLAAVALAAAVITLVIALVPVSLRQLQPKPDPTTDFAEALRRFDILHAEEAPICFPAGVSLLMHHGRPTARAYIFVHGTTNSPRQFEELGRLLWARGHNVLVMRQPHHGLKSRRLSELRHLKADELRQCADRAVDIAAGLGAEIVACGISGGAVLAGWMAQYRAEVTGALLLVPFLAFHGVPTVIHDPLVNLLCRVPSIVLEDPLEPRRDWVYRGQTTRALAETLRLGRAVLREAATSAPTAGEIFVLTTAGDLQVANEATARLAGLWSRAGTAISRYEFERSLRVPHNAVDPAADPEKKRVVYAKMLDLLGEAPETPVTVTAPDLAEKP